MSKRQLPPSASVATQGDGERMVAPAASRNSDVLCDLLSQMAPATGQALEIASGTGQHVTAFAQRLPGLHWQPTEIEPERRASINAYAADLSNVRTAASLDATVSGWHEFFAGQDLIVLVNLLHLISWPETDTLLCETAKALRPGGRFILYGPFMRCGSLTSPGDERFHSALIQQDPAIGYKNDADIVSRLENNGLRVLHMVDMPANNLAFVAEKPTT